MARRARGLTARRVETESRAGMFGDGGGLYLLVADSGAKSWVLRFQLKGRRRDMGLGSAEPFSLAEARERARAMRRLVAEGIDPIEKRRADRVATAIDAATAMTFSDCATAYIAAHRAGWRNEKHAGQWSATLGSYVHPIFGELPVAAVDTGLVLKAVEPIWPTKPETA